MGIDASIYGLVGQGVPQIDVAGSLGKGMQLKQLRQAADDDQAMREISQAAGGDIGRLADLAQGRGLWKQAQDLRAKQLAQQKDVVTIQKTLGEIDEQGRKAIQAGTEDALKFAAWAKTPEQWTQGIDILVRDHPRLAPRLAQFREYTPQNREAVLYLGATTTQALEALKPKVEERSGAMVPVTTDLAGNQTVGAPVGVKAQDPVAQVNQDLANGVISPEEAAKRKELLTTRTPAVQVNVGEKEAFKNETTLRKEYNDEIKAFRAVKDGYNRLQAAAKDQTAASDVALIYGYMKLLDPGSVVREGEFATAQNAAGLPTQLVAAYNKALNGTRLAPETRADFIAQAEGLYQKALAGQTAVKDRYTRIAQGAGLNPSNVVTDEGTLALKPHEGKVATNAQLSAWAKEAGISVVEATTRWKQGGGRVQ